jgi:type VI secretion system protein ImpG
MNDPLLQLYQDQLDALRTEARRFAERYALARELDLNEDGKSRDPSVERLLQGTAFLAARIEKRLSDDFPELTESLLSVVNPLQIQPYPPVTIVQFAFPYDRPSGEEPVPVPSGTVLECKQSDSDVKPRFVTRWPLVLPRVRVKEATLGPALRSASLRPREGSGVINELRLVLEPLSAQASAQDLLLYLHSPASNTGFSLFELIAESVDHIAISSGGITRYLEADALEMLGPHWDVPMVPPPLGADALRPYSLLADLSALPEKFLFFRVAPPSGAGPLLPPLPQGGERQWTVVIYLRREAVSLQHRIKPDLFRLGCVPAVNLFPMTAEFPNRWTALDQPIEPDRQRRSSYEVHSVIDVTASRVGGSEERVRFEPLYHPRQVEAKEIRDPDLPVVGYWHMTRRPTDGRPDCARGTDAFLRVVDPTNFRAWEGTRQGASASGRGDGLWAISADLLVTNRNLIRDIPGSERGLELTPVEGGKQQLDIRTLVRPTESGRTHLTDLISSDSAERVRPSWRAVAAMTAQRTWLLRPGRSGAGARMAITRAFRDILRLHNFHDDPQKALMSSKRIRGIADVEFVSEFGRVATPEGDRMCQGLKIRLNFNEDEFSDGSMYLYSAALERMLGFLAPINSFVQLESLSRQRGGKFGQWRKRAGELLLT